MKLVRSALFFLGSAVVSIAGFAVTIQPVSVGTSSYREIYETGYDPVTGTSGPVLVELASFTAGGAPGPISIRHWTDYRGIVYGTSYGTEETRGWASFKVPRHLPEVYAASLTGTFAWYGGAPLRIGAASGLPGIGEVLTGDASRSVFDQLGGSSGSLNSPTGAGTVPLPGSVLAHILSQQGGLLYLTFSLENQFDLTLSDLRLDLAAMATPLPGAAWMFMLGIAGLFATRRIHHR
jgi:hypothetical protein